MSYIYNLTDSWTAVGTSYSGIKMAITNTASAATSYMLNLSVSGATTASFLIDKSGNITTTGVAARFIADFDNATVNSRFAFQTTTTNAATGIYALPNGSSTAASWQATNAANPTNASKILIATNGSTDVQLVSGINGTGTYLPLSIWNSGGQTAQFSTTRGTFTLGVAGTAQGILSLTGATSGTVSVQGAAAAGTWTWTLPTDVPAANNSVLTASTAGVSSWTNVALTNPASAATITPTAGTTTVLSGGTLREVLTANRNYYVRTDGSDSNNGLANTAGGAFLTIQKAINTAYALDLSIYNVTINVATGTYTGNITATGPYVGSGALTISGDTTTPSNVNISTTGICISATKNAVLSVQGVKLTAATALACINSATGSVVTLSGKSEFGACASGHHVYVDGGYFLSSVAEVISGNAGGSHYYANSGGVINCQSATWTASGTVAVASFAQTSGSGAIYAFANSSSGTFTGARYSCALNGTINTNGGGASYFPGSVAGSTATGGQYA